MTRLPAFAVAAAALLGACRWSPLGNKVDVGQEPYLVFVADGAENAGDLYLTGTAGGEVFRLTFTRVDERLPALDPSGGMVVFARGQRVDGPAFRVVVMNLWNGSERVLAQLPGVPDRLAWAEDGAVLIDTGEEILRAPAPPEEGDARRIAPAELPAADSALATVLGTPPFATVVPCDTAGLCLRLADGTDHPLDPAVREAARWGGDSVVYVVGSRIEVRGLGPGLFRQVRWSGGPEHPRQVTVFLP